MSSLIIKDLHTTVSGKEILRGLNLEVEKGKVHAIMGPNGSGKSTLSKALGGHPDYEVTGGDVLMDGVSILEMAPDERSRAGLFLAFQYPMEIPGVSNANFLRAALQETKAAQSKTISTTAIFHQRSTVRENKFRTET